MKPFRRQVLDAFVNKRGEPPLTTTGGTSPEPPPQPPQANRHQRRKQGAFNRLLTRRLKKDGTNATVKVLPDGGIHIEAKASPEDPAHAHGPDCQHDHEE